MNSRAPMPDYITRRYLGALPNLQVLCFVLGYQGGTLHQIANELGIAASDILDADYDQMGELCRKAQKLRSDREVRARLSPA